MTDELPQDVRAIIDHALEVVSTEKLREFVRESNRIEGIVRQVKQLELSAHRELLAAPELTVELVSAFVLDIAHAELRIREGMDVLVGDHFPPRGGPSIQGKLAAVLVNINERKIEPWEAHIQYETIHPFIDGNGRSGRAIWAWQMLRDGRDPFALPFLHRWYYDTLSQVRD